MGYGDRPPSSSSRASAASKLFAEPLEALDLAGGIDERDAFIAHSQGRFGRRGPGDADTERQRPTRCSLQISVTQSASLSA